MRQVVGSIAIAACLILACGGSTPPPEQPTAAAPAADAAALEDAAPMTSAEADMDATAPEVVTTNPTEPSNTPSSMSYEEATATPEPLRLHDDRIQLTDAQLNGPMRGVIGQCRLPANAKLTIKTAVQAGHAIGVTVIVDLNKPKPKGGKPKRLSAAQAKAIAAAAKAEAKLIAKIRTCIDRTVRALTWPPSPRRDAFTTTF